MRVTVRFAVLLVAAAALAALAQRPGSPAGPTPAGPSAAQPAAIGLSTWAGLLRSMTVTVAGAARPFIFDTGGGETMITPDVAAAIGCTPYGRAIGFRAGGDRVAFQYCDDVVLRLGDVAIAHERVGVFDLTSLLPAGLPPAHGVVSLRSFRAQPVTIDLTAGKVTVETAASAAARTKVMRPLAIRVATGPTGAEATVYVGARVAGQQVWLLLDSGNGDSALLALHVAEAAGLKDGKGEVRLDIDGLGPVRVQARSWDAIYDGVLGVAFMQDWVFTFDLAAGRAWAARVSR